MKYWLVLVLVFASNLSGSVHAALAADRTAAINELAWVDFNASVCSGAGNYAALDQLLDQATIERLKQNEALYKELETELNFPWQLIAALHYKETSVSSVTQNPGNNQGIFQLYSLVVVNGTHDYPAHLAISIDGNETAGSPATPQSFKNQTRQMVEVIRGKKTSNYQANRRDLDLNTANDDALIKDYLFSYNGRNSGYSAYAATLGFDSATQGYEGSPYVMNMADASRQRMPAVRSDGGPIGSGDTRPGVFVLYKALSGAGSGSGTPGDIQGNDPGVINDNSLGVPLSPQATRGAQEARRLGHTSTIGGVARRSGETDHDDGYAIDVMAAVPGIKATGTDKELLEKITNHYILNRSALSIKYVIWYQQIAGTHTNWQWEQMEDRGGDTANHYDHIHVSFTGEAGGGSIINGCVGF